MNVVAAYHVFVCVVSRPLASLHEKQRTGYAATTILKQRTQTHDMLPQQYYNVIFIFLTRNFS